MVFRSLQQKLDWLNIPKFTIALDSFGGFSFFSNLRSYRLDFFHQGLYECFFVCRWLLDEKLFGKYVCCIPICIGQNGEEVRFAVAFFYGKIHFSRKLLRWIYSIKVSLDSFTFSDGKFCAFYFASDSNNATSQEWQK